jgi:hypothetical protein
VIALAGAWNEFDRATLPDDRSGEATMTGNTPSDQAISAMVDIAQMSGVQLTAGQRTELDGLIAHGLIEKIAPAGPNQPAKYALTASGQKLLDDRGVGANES